MTFNLNNAGDPAQPGQPSQQPVNQDQGTGAEQGMTQQQLAEILKRDENAQLHIRRIETENSEMRTSLATMQSEVTTLKEKLAAQAKVEELLARTQASRPTETNTNNGPVFDPSVVDNMVTEKLTTFFTEREQQANFSKVANELNSIFKDKSDEHVTKIAQSNGMTFDDAMNLAKHNPKFFENVFVTPYKTPTSAPASTMTNQNSGQVPSSNSEINLDYWNKLRRENPTKYFSVDTQKQYHKWFHEQNQNK